MEKNPESGVLFIDVNAKPLVAIKEEPDEYPSVKIIKAGIVRYKCGECSHAFPSTEQVAQHIRRHHRGQNPYQCSMCPYSTYNSTLFNEHVNIHKGIKPYQCIHCPYSSVSKKYVKKHESQHTKCRECGFMSKNRKQFKVHLREKGCNHELKEEYPYYCEFCETSFPSKPCLHQHIKGHRQCDVCGVTLSKRLLDMHKKAEHSTTKEYIKEKKKRSKCKNKFNCKLCSWGSQCCNRKILLHLIHHPEQEIPEGIDVTPLVKMGIFDKKDY